MVCPSCGGETAVTQSMSKAVVVYRSRKCKQCRLIFQTTEQVAMVRFNRETGRVFSSGGLADG